MTREQRQAEQTAQRVAAMREFMRQYPDVGEAAAARWAVTGSVRCCMWNKGTLANIKAVREAYAAGK